MTKPDWRHIDTVTEEMFLEGEWVYGEPPRILRLNRSNLAGLRACCDNYATTHVYGPIPDPPKPPPKIRRFEAVHQGKAVSGAYCKGEWHPERVRIWQDSGVIVNAVPWTDLSDIRWLDEE